MNRMGAKIHVISISFLITGNLIGAGILALPVNTGLAGLIPSLVGMVIIGVAMFFSAMVLSHQAVCERSENFNYPSLYHRYLGWTGKWVAIAANMLILYGLLTAYITGASAIIANLFNIPIPHFVIVIIFFVVLTALNITGLSVMRKYNMVFMFLLWASFAVIVFLSYKRMDTSRFAYKDWMFVFSAVPIIVTSFHFHNIIPTICKALDWDMKVICKTMIIGMCVGFLMNAIWIWVSLGALPLTGASYSIMNAFKHNLPATVPLAARMKTPLFMAGSLLFALLAIMTSYLANGAGLMDFNRDLLHNHLKLKKNRILVIGVTFLPPLAIALTYPNIFLKSLNIVGGFGIVLLFGVLPSIIAVMRYRTPFKRVFSFVMLALFSVMFLLEVAQETGLLKINPQVERWTHTTHKRVRKVNEKHYEELDKLWKL